MARFGRSRRQSAAIEKVPHMVEHHNEDHKTTPSIQRIQSHPARFHQHTCKHVSSSQHFLICSDVWASYPSAALDATNQPPEQVQIDGEEACAGAFDSTWE